MGALDRHIDNQDMMRKHANWGFALAGILGVTVASLVFETLHLIKRLEYGYNPAFVFVDEMKHAHPTDYQSTEFDPDSTMFEGVVKSYLEEFCSLQFRLNRRTVAEDLPEATRFMADEKMRPLRAKYRDGWINRFIDDFSQQEISYEWRNTSLESLNGCGPYGEIKSPCKAEVEFIETVGTKSRACSSRLEFEFVLNRRTAKNPLGLTIFQWDVSRGAQVEN